MKIVSKITVWVIVGLLLFAFPGSAQAASVLYASAGMVVPRVEYWTVVAGSAGFDEVLQAYCLNRGASATFQFSGTQVVVVEKGLPAGVAYRSRYTIDGTTLVDYFHETSVDVAHQMPFRPPLLAEGLHTVRVENVAASGTSGDRLCVESIQAFAPDSTPPTLAIAGASSGVWYNTHKTVTPAASDPSGIAEQSVAAGPSGPWTTSLNLGEGLNQVYCRARDLAGNWAEGLCATVQIDLSAPQAVLHGFNPNTAGWMNAAAEISVSGDDAPSVPARDGFSGSGIAQAQVSLDQAAWASVLTLTQTPPEGQVVHYRVVDGAGNVTLGSEIVRVDTIPPQLDSCAPMDPPDVAGGWYSYFAYTHTIGTDDTSGIAAAEVGSPTAWGPSPGIQWRISPAAPLYSGEHSMICRLKDLAGNYSDWMGGTIKVDMSVPQIFPPELSPDGENGWFITPALVPPALAEDPLSGIAPETFQMSEDLGQTWKAVTEITLSQSVLTTLRYRVYDLAGHLGEAELVVKVDRDGPVSLLEAPPVDGLNGWYRTAPLLKAGGSDNLSGLGSTAIRLEGGLWAPSLTQDLDGVWEVETRTADLAGNTTTAAWEVRVDQHGPLLIERLPPPDGQNGWYVTPVVVGVAGVDETSGLDLIEYRVNNGPWQGGEETMLNQEGRHVVTFRAADRAGNIAISQEIAVQVDRSLPTLELETLPFAAGISRLEGMVSDEHAGIEGVEVSLDAGLTWQRAEIEAQGWHYEWDTTLVEDGPHTYWVRAVDLAGNSAQIQGGTWVVNDTAPYLGVIGEVRNHIPILLSAPAGLIEHLEISILEEDGSLVRSYPLSAPFPERVTWDGFHEDRSTPAASGQKYRVLISAQDVLGRKFSREVGMVSFWFLVFLPQVTR